MQCGNLFNDGEAQARNALIAALAGGIVFFPDVGKFSGIDPFPVVTDLQNCMRTIPADRDGDPFV